jgi:hypothetical protein
MVGKAPAYLFIAICVIHACCKVDTTIKKDPIEMRHVSFNLFAPHNYRSQGSATIFYTYNGEKKYVVGNAEAPENRNTTDSITNAIISLSLPVYSSVNYSILCVESDSSTLKIPALKVACNDNVLVESTTNQSSYSGEYLTPN